MEDLEDIRREEEELKRKMNAKKHRRWHSALHGRQETSMINIIQYIRNV